MVDFIPEIWKVVAWNGVSMRVPAQWEVGSLGTSYLQLEDQTGPVLELKWQQLKKFFSHQTHLKKLARLSNSTPGLDFEVTPLPEDWKQSLRNFDARSFKWKGGQIGGKGAILHCSYCGKASLLQFYHNEGGNESLVPVKVLQTFRDHREDGVVLWALFGLRAIMPQKFGLVGYHFHPGHYQLKFQWGQEQITLSRWGPADVLLKNGDLLEWFGKSSGELDRNSAQLLRTYDYYGNQAVQGQSRRVGTAAKRLWARISKKSPKLWVRVWHLSSHNQILGVVARGLTGLDESALEEICTNYEMV